MFCYSLELYTLYEHAETVGSFPTQLVSHFLSRLLTHSGRVSNTQTSHFLSLKALFHGHIKALFPEISSISLLE